MGEMKKNEEKNIPMVPDEENFLRLEKAFENEIKETKLLNEEIKLIKDLLIEDKKEEEKEKKELENKELQEEKVKKELQEKEELLLLDEIRHDQLIETISTPQEFESIKDEMIVLNNNIVSIYESSLIFFGFVVAILVSSIFLKGIFK